MKIYLFACCFAAFCLISNAAAGCNSLSFQTPVTYEPLSARLMQETYTTGDCSVLVIDTTSWMCTPFDPIQTCRNNSDCANGYCTASHFCVSCSVNGTGYTSPEKFEVIANVTQAIIDRKIWTIDDYYDHTNVDYIQTYQKWSWTPNGQALQHELVQYSRHLGRFVQSYDDSFYTLSRVYEVWNSTHVRYRSQEMSRRAHDVTGVIDMGYSSTEHYYTIVNPK